MIYQTFKSKKQHVFTPAPVALPAPKDNTDAEWSTDEEKAFAKKVGVSVDEYVRRDMLIKQLATECPFQGGDTAYPSIKKDYEEYGPCLIIGICRSYKDFGLNNKWPKTDNPMIVTFAPLKQRNQHIFCTTNYLVKRNPHMVVC